VQSVHIDNGLDVSTAAVLVWLHLCVFSSILRRMIYS